MNLHQIARALGGQVSGKQVIAPGPNHSKGDRSLSVKLCASSLDGFVAHSFAGDDWRYCRDYVKARLGIAAPYVETRNTQREKPKETKGNRSFRARAQELFAECLDPRGSVADYYLEHQRKLAKALDDVTALTLRFHPKCPFRDGEELVRAPALVAALRDPREAMGACNELGDMDAIERRYLRDVSKVTAVQRIRLTMDGRKIERRSLGEMENAVVFIGSIWESFYGAEATIGEGVETMLAMRALGFNGCVALAGSGRFERFEPPFHWGNIVISGENDPKASEKAWRSAGPRWAKAGHFVTVWTPPDPKLKDANDLVCHMAKEARAA